MYILGDLGVTAYINDAFITDDNEEENLEWLQKVVERITDAGLKLNLKKRQLGRFRVDFLGFQVPTDLGLSEVIARSCKKSLHQHCRMSSSGS